MASTLTESLGFVICMGPSIMLLFVFILSRLSEWLDSFRNGSRQAGADGVVVPNILVTEKSVKERLGEYTMEIKSCRVVKRANSVTSLVGLLTNGGAAGVDVSTTSGTENSNDPDLNAVQEGGDTSCREISYGGTQRKAPFFNQLLRSASFQQDSSGTVPTIVIPKPGVPAPPKAMIPVASRKINVPSGKAADETTNNEVEVAAAKVALTADGVAYRAVPNVCAICLMDYVAGDRVSWSSNKKCVHAFHESCAFQWIWSSYTKNKNEPPRCPCCRNFFLTYAKPAKGRKAQQQEGAVEVGRQRDNEGQQVEGGGAQEEIADEV